MRRLGRLLVPPVLVLGVVLVAAGCGSAHPPSTPHSRPALRLSAHADRALAALIAERRPVGNGPRFRPAATGPVPGACRRRLGPRFGVHVEVFAENRVVLLPAGIGTRGPRTVLDARVTRARCYGALVTLDPTGVVLVRPGARLNVADLFRAWGEPLGPRRLAGFTAPPTTTLHTFVAGRRRRGDPGTIPLTRHAEIVLELAPYVPPHRSFTFASGL